MHDLHIAQKISKKILEIAQKNNLKKIKRADITLGQIEEHGKIIKPENLIFNIKMLGKGTVAENIEIKIAQSEKADFWELLEIEGS